MPDIYELAKQHRQRLLEREAASGERMARAYDTAAAGIRFELQGLLAKIEEAEADGETVNRAWLKRRERLQTLLSQANEELRKANQFAANEIAVTQLFAAEQAQSDAQEQAESVQVGVQWNRLSSEALTDLVGFMGDGSPLSDAFNALAPEDFKPGNPADSYAKRIGDALIRGMALGKNPKAIARDIERVAEGAKTRALLIARTETLRAYRESSRRSYEAHGDIVAGWRWVCALGARSCPVCIAMHGRIFPVTEPFGSHPACRCASTPVLRGREDEAFVSGEEWLQKQEQSLQDTILGKAAGAAYRSGAVGLSDFVEEIPNDRWGLTRRRKALKNTSNKKDYATIEDGDIQINSRVNSGKQARSRIEVLIKTTNKTIDVVEQKIIKIENEIQVALSNDDSKQFRILSIRLMNLNEQKQALIQKQRNEVLNVLFVQNPINIGLTRDESVSNEMWSRTTEVTSFVQKVLPSGLLVNNPVIKIEQINGRMNYDERDYTLQVSADRKDSLIAHELGHWLEYRNPNTVQATLRFHEKRTKGEDFVYLKDVTGNKSYGNERTKVDRFIDPYMGKLNYNKDGTVRSTEILSMGLQLLYSDPVRFARSDPEYFDFMINLLHGKLDEGS